MRKKENMKKWSDEWLVEFAFEKGLKIEFIPLSPKIVY
jgi:hypothetical protein